jgi:hypothetical protein
MEYLNDNYVTSVLLRDMQNGKMSDELAKIFLEIQEKVLKKPNFAGYYAGLKDAIKSEGVMLFMRNWNKFKPYRVKNNYKVMKSGKFLTRDGKHKSNVLYLNFCPEKYDMLEIDNRTYSVKECKKISENEYEIHLFNKLKNNISKNSKVVYLKPKVDLFDYNSGQLKGGFTFLTTFAFTGATNKITQHKKEQQQMQEILDKYNSNINYILDTSKPDAEGYIKRDLKDFL